MQHSGKIADTLRSLVGVVVQQSITLTYSSEGLINSIGGIHVKNECSGKEFVKGKYRLDR